MTAAIIRVRIPSGASRSFAAERVDIDDGLVTATGVWCGTRDRRRRTYTWSQQQVIEIRWGREAAIA